MAAFGSTTSPSAAGRRMLAVATIVSVIIGLAGDRRFFAAAAAFGALWWAWDFLWGSVLGPLGRWFTGMLTGTVQVEDLPDLSVDDTMRLLESHLANEATAKHVQIQSAIRLAEMYRTNRHDDARAREVVERVRARFPDAPELKAFEKP